MKNEDIMHEEILGESLDVKQNPVHATIAKILLEVPVSEASVERAFSRHKLVHSRLRANLGAERLDDILFIRYNLEAIMKLPSLVQEMGTIAE